LVIFKHQLKLPSYIMNTFANEKTLKLIKELEVQRELVKSEEEYNQKISEEFRNKVSYDEYKAILDGIIKLLSDNSLVKARLSAKGELRFKKKSDETEGTLKDNILFTNLPRTLQIYTNDKNEFTCIIETKSKLANGKKDPDKKDKTNSGTYKTCKPSYQLNPPIAERGKEQIKVGDPETQTVSLVMKYDNPRELQDARKEANISKETEAGVKLFSFEYSRVRDKVVFYANKGVELQKLLDSKDFEKLTMEDKKDIFISIVKELKILHDAGIIHQDIKPANIIVFKDSNSNYTAKLHDFGICNRVNNRVLATVGYESPIMEKNNYNKNTYGNYYSTLASHTLNDKNIARQNYLYNLKHDKSNDLWALGVVYLQLIYFPKLKAYNLNKCNFEEIKLVKPLDNVAKRLLDSYQEPSKNIYSEILNMLDPEAATLDSLSHKEESLNDFCLDDNTAFFNYEPKTEPVPNNMYNHSDDDDGDNMMVDTDPKKQNTVREENEAVESGLRKNLVV